MLKAFRGVTTFYANSTVYITNGNDVQKLKDYNYQLESLTDDGDDMWVTSGVVVALGACCEPRDAIRQLKHIIKRLELEL